MSVFKKTIAKVQISRQATCCIAQFLCKKNAPRKKIILRGAPTENLLNYLFTPTQFFHFFTDFKSSAVASIRLRAKPPLRASLTDILVLLVTIPFLI